MQYKVLFFRDQDITPAQHIELARRFGELEVNPSALRGVPRDRRQHPVRQHGGGPRQSATGHFGRVLCLITCDDEEEATEEQEDLSQEPAS